LRGTGLPGNHGKQGLVLRAPVERDPHGSARLAGLTLEDGDLAEQPQEGSDGVNAVDQQPARQPFGDDAQVAEHVHVIGPIEPGYGLLNLSIQIEDHQGSVRLGPLDGADDQASRAARRVDPNRRIVHVLARRLGLDRGAYLDHGRRHHRNGEQQDHPAQDHGRLKN
jgi:hypothetical protein